MGEQHVISIAKLTAERRERARAAKRTLQNGFEKETNPAARWDFFLDRGFTYLLLIPACTLETVDNCTALTINRRRNG